MHDINSNPTESGVSAAAKGAAAGVAIDDELFVLR